jgi:hypothetical protein
LNHHFGRLYDDLNRIARLQIEFLGALARDHALDHTLAHLDYDASHDVAEVNLLNDAWQLVSSGKFHTAIAAEKSEHSLARDPRIVTAEAFEFAPKVGAAQNIVLHAGQIQIPFPDHQIVTLADQRNKMQSKYAGGAEASRRLPTRHSCTA